MLHKMWERRFVRFCCVGLFNTGLDFSLLNILVFRLGIPVLLANAMSVSVGVCTSYVLNNRIVFSKHEPLQWSSFFRFLLVTGASVLIVQTVVIFLSRPLYHELLIVAGFNADLQKRLSVNLAKATAVGVGMVWNYVLYHKVVFKKTAIPTDVEA